VPLEWWYWNATRVISHPPGEAGPINELPYFTLLFADLHAHLMSLPYTLLALALTVAVATSVPAEGGRRRAREAPALALLALALGALWPLNAWDFPTYLMLAAAGLVVREWGRRGRLDAAAWRGALLRFLAVAVLARVLFAPFHARFASAYGEVERWRGSRTPLDEYLTIHGLFLYCLLGYVVAELAARGTFDGLRRWVAWRNPFRRLRGEDLELPRPPVPARGWLAAWAAAAAVLLLGGDRVGLFALSAGALGTVLLLARDRSPAQRLLVVLVLSGLALTWVVEVATLRGDIGRMNTVFKSYLQVWVLWAVATAGAAAATLARWQAEAQAGSGDAGPWWRRRPAQVALALFAAALLYPLLATPARLRDRFDPRGPRTLDGEAFLETAVVHDQGGRIALAADLAAIRWLRENVAGTPVIAEASVPPYRWGSRVSVHTGLPTIVGWDWHQRQQRAALGVDPVAPRLADLRTIYETTDARLAWQTLRRYRAELLVLGALERLYHPGPGLAKFADRRFFAPVYANPEVAIYRVATEPPGASP
jgi:YYY domain-containing protein